MEKLIFLFLLVILPFVVHQDANALTISAIPVKQEFGANEWIKVNVTIQGYNGGQVNWIAHRPDNSTISGVLDQQQIRSGRTIHQIIRSADDNEFGLWLINYGYGGSNQTAHVNVKPLDLIITIDKSTYYEPDTMNINITSSSYTPYAKFAHSYFLDFYDQNGNKVIGVDEIEVKADQLSVTYHFPMLQFAKYNPPGLYKLKIQYFNSVKYVPFLLSDINKLMEISVNSKALTYYPGDDVVLDLFVTRVKESTGSITITDSTGNTTNIQFPVNSTHNELSLKNITKKIGIYKFDVQYAGVENTGTFTVVANNGLPKIDLDVYLNKWNYRKGEIVEARVYISNITSNSINSWVTDPQGVKHETVSIPVSLNDVIVPHKIDKNDQVGKWQFYVSYGGTVQSSTFYVGGETMDDSELLNSGQFLVPKYPSNISSEFNSPTGIAIDSDNNIYITDSGNSQIKKFDSKGKLLYTVGTLGSSTGEFRHPLGIFVNEKYVYVLDTGNSRIQMFDKNGSFIYSWGEYGDQHGMFHTPVSMSSDKYGNLFVTDSEQNVIQIFDSLGNYKDEIHPTLEEGKEIGGLGIKAITFDSKNNFYIISTNNEILKYSGIGNFINFYGSNGTEDGRFNQPSAIAVDAKDYLYVADSGAHRIQKFDSHGNFIFSWGSAIDETGEFDAPTGLAIDTLNNIYVVDKNQGIAEKFATDNAAGVILPNWIKKNSLWWSEGALDKSDFALAMKYIIKQGLIQISPTLNYNSMPVNSSASVDQLRKEIQLWSSGKIDHIPLISDNSIEIPEWVKKNVQLWAVDKIDDQTFFKSIEHLLSLGIMKI